MYAEISAAIQSLQALAELAKGANSLANRNLLVAAVADVNAKLVEATAVALAGQERQSELLAKVADLERKVLELSATQIRAERYALHKFPTEALAYKLKEGGDTGEPMHFICAKCSDSGSHSKYQPWGNRRLKCFTCEGVIQTEADPPAKPARLVGRSSYLDR